MDLEVNLDLQYVCVCVCVCVCVLLWMWLYGFPLINMCTTGTVCTLKLVHVYPHLLIELVNDVDVFPLIYGFSCYNGYKTDTLHTQTDVIIQCSSS